MCRSLSLNIIHASSVRGLVQTIFGKINVIVTLWGEGVIGHDV